MSKEQDTGPLILVVDDIPDTRRMMKQFLELEGYRVTEAADGEEAIDLALSVRPRLILMDLSMPGVDGAVGGAEDGACRWRVSRQGGR